MTLTSILYGREIRSVGLDPILCTYSEEEGSGPTSMSKVPIGSRQTENLKIKKVVEKKTKSELKNDTPKEGTRIHELGS